MCFDFYPNRNLKKALNDDGKAIELYKEVAKACEKQTDYEGARRYIGCLRKHAKCCTKLKQNAEAHKLLDLALKSTLKHQKLEGDLELISSIYDDLAFTYMHLGDLKNFSKSANTALKLKQEHYGSDHLQTAMAMISAG